MRAYAFPIPSENVAAWREFAKELMGPRRKEFDAYNERWGLTLHRAYLQQNPDGYVVVALHEGPGEDRFLTAAVRSNEGFDGWFGNKLKELHGIDFTTASPPKVEMLIDARAANVGV